MDRFAAALEADLVHESRHIHVKPEHFRMVGREPPAGWWARRRADLDTGNRAYARSQPGIDAPDVLEALSVDDAIASHLFWLGHAAEAHAMFDREIGATADWQAGRVRLWSDENKYVRRAHDGRTRALLALTRPDGDASGAVAHARAALLARIRGDHENAMELADLPFVHLVAMAREMPDCSELVEFRTNFPWLTGLIDWTS